MFLWMVGNTSRPEVTYRRHSRLHLPFVKTGIKRAIQINLQSIGPSLCRGSKPSRTYQDALLRADVRKQSVKFLDAFYVDGLPVIFPIDDDGDFVLSNSFSNENIDLTFPLAFTLLPKKLPAETNDAIALKNLHQSH
jgi:hypothetical protein